MLTVRSTMFFPDSGVVSVVAVYADGSVIEMATIGREGCKPVAMIADAIRDCSNRGGLILDPFGGAGTTLIAAERTDAARV